MNELFTKIIHHALVKQATDIHILLKNSTSISFRVFGKLLPYQSYNFEDGKRLLNFIRFQSNIDLNHSLKPQTGHFNYLLKNHIYYIRVSSLPGKDVDSIVIRILNNHQSLTLEQLCVLPDVYTILKSITKKETGLFVISGATGSGKSTTLYTLLDTIYEKTKRNIVTLEDPIEIKKEYCLQIQLNEKMGITYEDSLKQILRHDPDVIMIGEIRDAITAKLAITCALTGHLVLSTIHASNCLTTIRRFLNLGVLAIDLEDVLLGVVSQKMLYHSNTNQPIILAECLNRKQSIEYLTKEKTAYRTFQENAKFLLENRYLCKEQVEVFLDE